MAQAGYTPISLYYSTTAAAAPTSGNLANGELAINITDGKLYYKDNGGVVQLIASKAGASGSVTSVAMTVPSFLSVSGSPITSSGTLAVSLSGTALPVANGGTGQTTASAAFNALSPITTAGDLIIGNGANSATRLPIGANSYILTSNGTTATWAAAPPSGASISNDTSTASNLYPLFSSATTGAPTTIYTSNAKLLYKPSTGELQASELVASNGLVVNSTTVSASYTIASGTNAMSVGPITVASGQSVTVSSGQKWVVI